MSPFKKTFLTFFLGMSLSTGFASGEFQAKFQEEFGIRLTWKRNIDTEDNYFILERSPDGSNYIQIAEINEMDAENNGSYIHQDRRHNIGFNYYRLSLVSQEGGIMATFLAVEEAYQLTNNLVIYPNPSSGNIKISTFNTLFERANIYVYDTMGREVFRKENIVPTNDWSLDLDLSYLRPGLYMLYYQSDKRLKKNSFPITLLSAD